MGWASVVGLLLDCDAGTLTVKKNGVRLGVAKTGLTGEWCRAASLCQRRGAETRSVRIAAADAAAERWWQQPNKKTPLRSPSRDQLHAHQFLLELRSPASARTQHARPPF